MDESPTRPCAATSSGNVGGERHGDQAGGAHVHERDDQAAPLHQVAQGQEKEDACSVAHLGRRGNEARLPGLGVEVEGKGAKEWLVVVHVGHRDPAGGSHQPEQFGGKAGGRFGRHRLGGYSPPSTNDRKPKIIRPRVCSINRPERASLREDVFASSIDDGDSVSTKRALCPLERSRAHLSPPKGGGKPDRASTFVGKQNHQFVRRECPQPCRVMELEPERFPPTWNAAGAMSPVPPHQRTSCS